MALTPIQKDPLHIRRFNIERLDDYDEPLMKAIPLENPISKGRSQAVNRQLFKSSIIALNLATKYVKVRVDIMRSAKSGRAALAIAFRRRGF